MTIARIKKNIYIQLPLKMISMIGTFDEDCLGRCCAKPIKQPEEKVLHSLKIKKDGLLNWSWYEDIKKKK